ncbi:MAG: OmpH family outer membrane protein [Muribaculaceae bacterium]|nr:OmpH family outer membrane protein [Muribaculaceae bacterium]MDE6299435.1 OmpH family outer membrane protein [Muribaculaceae bacterium]
MKKNLISASAFALALGLAFGVTSCANDSKQETPAPKKSTSESVKTTDNLPNYRYVDSDSILKNYHLSKDYTEEMLRMQNNMESELKRHENSIQAQAAAMNKKMQNNQYLSETEVQTDQQKLNNLQTRAQNSMASLQKTYENAALNGQKAVNDSIEAFIKEYNAKKGYDAIFYKNATIYINPALDVTNEVIEGLNARYNKVKK